MSDSPPAVSIIKHFDASDSFEDLLKKLGKEFASIPFKDVEKFHFTFDGLAFNVHRAEQGNGRRFLMSATIGYMPFTIESTERRKAIQTIILSSRRLPTVRFGVSVSGKISAAAMLEVPHMSAPDSLFYPLTLFMQEARPFIQLIGQYLVEPTPVKKRA
jgi:hypothetical protein